MRRRRRCRCRPRPRQSLSVSVSPLLADASLRLFTSCGGRSRSVPLCPRARCNKWPAAEESRLRQKGDAEPFLCGGPDTFCVENNNASSLLRFVRSLSLLLVCILFTGREWSETGMPTHRISRACKACMALSKAKHTIFCYRSLTPHDPLRPPSLPPTERVRRTPRDVINGLRSEWLSRDSNGQPRSTKEGGEREREGGERPELLLRRCCEACDVNPRQLCHHL